MKIGFASDLHFDYNQRHFTDDLASLFITYINTLELDYLFISGDLSSNYEHTIDLIETFNERSDTAIYFVPGNHDVWMKDQSSVKSLKKLNQHKYCLVNKQLKLTNDWYAIGSFPWYDYTLETLGKSQTDYESEKIRWPDAKYTDWKVTNPDFLTSQLDMTKEVIEGIEKDKNVILMEHFVPTKEFIVHEEGNDRWNFGNAFMGSKNIRAFAESYKNIKTVCFGHTHHRFDITRINNIEYICKPVGYTHEWKTQDFVAELTACITVKILD